MFIIPHHPGIGPFNIFVDRPFFDKIATFVFLAAGRAGY
jgi:hypothetical protein